jgi:predicted ATPase/DNA-binding SARP family transcriptional activator
MDTIAQHTENLWRIALLGGLTVQYGDQSLAHFETRRAASLLACLAFYRHKRHTRDELIEMLWPDEDLEATRLRFRQVLTSLRKSLKSLDASGDTLLVTDRTFAVLDADRVTTDVAELESALKRATCHQSVEARVEALNRAIHLYTGELLPGHYEDWVSAERRHLTESYVSALTDLAQMLGRMGDTATAIEHIRKALMIDALREESHVCLIRLYAGAGRNSEALAQYRRLEQLLWKELRTLPSASSQALIEKVRAGSLFEHTPTASKPSSLPWEPTGLATPADQIPGGPRRPSLPSPSIAAPLTPFFGREREILWLVDQLQPAPEASLLHQTSARVDPAATTRLLTVTGIGGCGKTRLALEATHRLQAAYQGAVWFVPLADKEVGALASALTEVVCGPNAYTDGFLQQAITALAYRPALLVLDNFEQMIREGGLIVKTLLERVPTLKCLITSRQRLDIEGEQEYPLAPLPIPIPAETPERLLEFASVQLFVDRVQRVRPGFVLEADMAESIAGICAQLEGIPLALELAAAWMALLSPAQMQERLKQRFKLLVSRRQDIPERHRSMRATLEWSYRNLELEQRRFFARLAIFRGGWTLEAAEAVCSAPHALDYLAQLRQCSLVQAEETAAGMRFGMLELLREFAAEQLSAEEVVELRQRHRLYYLDLAERAAPYLTGPDQREWLLRLKCDYENLRFLLADSETPQGDREAGLRLFLALWRFWDVYRHYAEAEQWIQKLREKLTDVDPVWKARLLEAGGCLACNLWHFQKALAMLEESLSLYQAQGDRKGAARLLCSIAIATRQLGDYARAHQLFDECLPMLQEREEPFLVARALAGLAVLLQWEKDYTAASPLMEQAATLYRICGHKKGLAFCLKGQGTSALEQGDLQTARSFLERALATARDIEDAEQVQYSLYQLANVHQAWGDREGAQGHLREALSIAIATGAREWQAHFLIWLGVLAYDRADNLVALAYYRDAVRLCEAGEMTIHMTAVIRCIASLDARRGHTERALRLLGAASARNAETLFLLKPLQHLLQIDVEPFRQRLGSEAFERIWEQGRSWPWDQAIDTAKEAIAEQIQP